MFAHTYEDIISVENLLEAWKEFLKGKRGKKDVQEFQADLMRNILSLHRDLVSQTYCHGGYRHFRVADPKPRDIHKASVRDRLLHHALYRQMYPYFDARFISDSYSCRVGKGTHKAMSRFRSFASKVSKNHTRTAWVLKCDIRKFFASIDHAVLYGILQKHVGDPAILCLLREVVGSFCSGGNSLQKNRLHQSCTTAQVKCICRGLPLGNLTSQLLVNIYMNEFDQWIKHKLKVKYYIRYADDFVILSRNRPELLTTLSYMKVFMRDELKLHLHPNKTFVKTVASGIDFLGWVHFPGHRVLRTASKRRMLRRTVGLQKEDASVQSYFGMLKHGNARTLENRIGKN